MKATIKQGMLVLLVVMSSLPPVAHAEYLGTIDRQQGYTFEIVTGASVTTSITFISVVKGQLKVDNVVSANGSVPPQVVTISRSAERGILLIDTRGGSSLIRINSNGSHEFNADPGNRIVFDITG